MKLNILEDEPKSMVIEFIDVDKGIADLIRAKLVTKKDVEFASVVKTHPETGQPRLVIKSSRNARSLVLKALEEVQEEVQELASQFSKGKKST